MKYLNGRTLKVLRERVGPCKFSLKEFDIERKFPEKKLDIERKFSEKESSQRGVGHKKE